METEKIISELEFEKPNGNGSTNYLTHNFHTYPAKFIPQIPRTTIKSLTNSGDTILDPFCGCGTTLVEAKLMDRPSIGVDLNPIAILATKAKTTKLLPRQIKIIPDIIAQIREDIGSYYKDKDIHISYGIPEFNNRDHWFQKNVLHELAIIKAYIDAIEDEELRTFFHSAFSSIIVNVSNQESNTRFAAIEKNIEPFKSVIELSKKLDDMRKRILEFSKIASDSKTETCMADTRFMDFIESDSIDHIVTSPPYANTYDYYLYHKFRMYWLGYDVKKVQENEIGSRNRHSSKKEDISTFKENLSGCLKEMNRVLKKGKYAVIVIGDSVIRGELIKINNLMKEIALDNNFKFIREISYNLKNNTRMFNPKFTNGDKLEHIMFFKNEK